MQTSSLQYCDHESLKGPSYPGRGDIILKSVTPKGALCSSGEDIFTRRGTSSLNNLYYLLYNIIIQILGDFFSKST